MPIAKPLKAAPQFWREENNGDTIWSLGVFGNPLIGTNSADFLLSGQAGTITGLGSDDLILGDISNFLISAAGNNSFANAIDLDGDTNLWSTQENPLFADDAVPHVTIYISGEGTFEFFRVFVGAGQTVTIDVDGGGGTLGGLVSTDTTIELYVESNLSTSVANDLSAATTEGGYGSVTSQDPLLVFTNTGAGAVYFIRISETGGTTFEADDEFLLNVSLTGHAVGVTSAQSLDTIDGGTGDDHLFGAGGNDSLTGGTGVDLMVGGTGDDTYFVDDGGDGVAEVAGEGNDRVLAAASYVLATDASVEVIHTTDFAGSAAIDLTGSSIANSVSGNAGVNILRGEGGNDTLNGLGGNDFLVGGTGSDVMVGGTGDDTYYVDDTSDAITELAGEGNDRIAATITLALAADANIERIEVVNLTSTNAIDLTGSGIANIIFGNDGQNILRGEAGNDELRGFGGSDFLVGGTGTDLMVGGAGDDTFYVDDASDAIGEIAGEGNDRIAASVSFVLSNGANVELLEAVNLLATAAFDLTGSDSANTITGNNGVNILRGEGGNDILSSAGGDDFLVGGAGQDSMTGGAGNDTYYVDQVADMILEIAGEGTDDRVAASSTFFLGASADIERLEAATQSATNAMDLVGSSIANIILGNDGANVLDGKGGSDTLTGFGGIDDFQFSTALGAGNIDTITGFVSGSDRIRLDDAVFAALAPGVLPAGAFKLGASATEADDRIIYNSATGQLFYDADGDGAGAAVLFAILQGAPALAAADIQVI